MAKHNETGIKGEQIAEKFLLNNGYNVLHRNWCHGKKEVDIIAERAGILIFVEVKTRSGSAFGYPEDAVGATKTGYLKAAAEAFMAEYPMYTRIQFDVISILLANGQVQEITHFEDAFY
jgi:putative endonuclease